MSWLASMGGIAGSFQGGGDLFGNPQESGQFGMGQLSDYRHQAAQRQLNEAYRAQIDALRLGVGMVRIAPETVVQPPGTKRVFNNIREELQAWTDEWLKKV